MTKNAISAGINSAGLGIKISAPETPAARAKVGSAWESAIASATAAATLAASPFDCVFMRSSTSDEWFVVCGT